MRCLLLQSEAVVPAVESALAEPAWAIWLAWGAVPMAAVLLGLLAAGGVLSLTKLESSPRRDVGLGWMDALAGLWLWLLGSLLAGAAMAAWGAGRTEASGDAEVSPAAMLLMQVGVFGPAIGYWLWRVSRVPGGLGMVGLWPRAWGRELRWTLLGLPAIVLLFLATQQVSAVISLLMGSKPPEVQHSLLEIYVQLRDDGEHATMLGLLISTVVFAPVLEELFHRGFLQTAMVQVLGPGRRWLAMVAVAVFFAVLHLGSVPWVALPALVLLGVCFGFLYERTGCLWPSILVHAGFNAINVGYVVASP